MVKDYPVPGNMRPMPANLFPNPEDKYKVSRSGFRKLSVMYHPDKVTDEQGEGEFWRVETSRYDLTRLIVGRLENGDYCYHEEA
jgi:hypothetical protein